MNLVRNNIKRDFSQVPNTLINDNSLSDRARFLFCYMAAKPDEWKFYQDKMAKDLKMSVDTLRKYLAELIDSGWVSRTLLREGGKFDSYEYDLNPEPCRKNTDTVKNQVGKIPTRENSALNNTELEITLTKEKTKREKEGEAQTLPEQVIQYLNEKAKTSFKATTKETVQFINGRQKQDGWTFNDFKTVIDFKVDQWGRDDKMRQYICPSTLFRASNAEKYLQAAKSWQEGKKTASNGQIYTREDQAQKLVYDRVLTKPKLNKV